MLQTFRALNVLLLIMLMAAVGTARTQEMNAEKYPPGLIVEAVSRDTAADKAGLKSGDLLLALDGKSLRFDSDIPPLRDQARWEGRKTILLTVRRGMEILTLRLAVVPLFGFYEHPPFPLASQKLYDEAKTIPKEQGAGITAKWRAAAEAARKEGDLRAAAWLGYEVFLRTPTDTKEEQEALAFAIASAEEAGDKLLTGRCYQNRGNIAYSHNKLGEAETDYRHALAIQERAAPHSLNLAATYNNLANITTDVDEAEGYYKRSLAIQERLSPDSLILAACLNNLGIIAADRGNLEEAEGYYKRDLNITKRLAPDSLALASTLNNLGIVARARGKLDEAEGYYKLALAIKQRLAPASLTLASTLTNLGIVAETRGNLEEAEDYYKRDLNITERLAPDSLDLAATLNNLGNSARSLSKAEMYYKRALAIKQRLAPASLTLAASLNNLGLVAKRRGNFDEAESYYKRDLAITERLAPASLALALSFHNLGTVAKERGKLEEEETYFYRAWQIVLKQGKRIAGDNGRQEFGEANAFYAADLLLAQLDNHKPEDALITLEEGRAQALVQAMAERGITEKVTPPAIWQPYRKAETAYNAAFKEAERLAVPLEKAKAQLKDLQEQKAGETILRQKQQEIDEAEQVFNIKYNDEVRTREEMESRWGEVRRANKSALPPPINPIEARKRLPAGMLFLEFSVGEKEVTLFIASREYGKAFLLPISRKEVEQELLLVRQGIAGDTNIRGIKPDNPRLKPNALSVTTALRMLFQKLFPPEVQAAVQMAKRIVVSPDDFLWDLPFAALVTNTGDKPTYLGLQKPLSYAQSLTLFFTPGSTEAAPGTDVLVVGNPLYNNARRKEVAATQVKSKPSVKLAMTRHPSPRRSGELGMMTRSGEAPDQLEYAEQEAKQVAALYHTGAHVGIEPTEAWFRDHAGQAKILHLATHGFFNPFAPQSSGVLLAVPEKTPPDGQYDNDGTLQAWEVWSLKLNAELVILSACETGRGAKVTGEGLIGLTRAWQYAGAKTIVSSQWKVSDESTSALMVFFHKHLLEGVERDEALRLAMVEVASSPKRGWSSPHQWAAFLMVGETGKMR